MSSEIALTSWRVRLASELSVIHALEMFLKRLTVFIAPLLIFGSSLFAEQTPPPIYLGPYEQSTKEQFKGEWTRSDGTYQLIVEEVAGDLVVKYLNPKSINVETVTLNHKDEGLSLSVVLRDEGYPGSTYELEYLPQYRVLVGSYTIPGQAPTEVFFTK